MKILGIHAFYTLPDGFEGSLADGLRLLAEHLDDSSKPLIPPNYKYEGIVKEANELLFKRYWECPNKFVGFGSLAEQNEAGKTLRKMKLFKT